ncbi:hypothetical protein Ddc_14306 [Ditylenchus destructor]|nr:hypothetical protein Ddc_14306 [Ditylenchus destructor]
MSRYSLSDSRDISVPYSEDPDRCTIPLFGSSARRYSSEVTGQRSGNVPPMEEDNLHMAMTRTLSSWSVIQCSSNRFTPYQLSKFDAYRSDREIPLLYSTWFNVTSRYYGQHTGSLGLVSML